MTRTRSTFSRSLLVGAAALALAAGPMAGCSGGGDDDDDDDGAGDLNYCQILWSSAGANVDRYDVYIVDMPIEDWTTGQKEFENGSSNQRVGLVYDEYSFEEREWVSSAVTTGGTFNVTVASTSMGGLVQFSDDGLQYYFEIEGDGDLGAAVASGGQGVFDGEWSDPDPDTAPTGGSGEVTLAYLGSAGELTFGGFINFAVCYDDSTNFAPSSAVERATRQFENRFRP